MAMRDGYSEREKKRDAIAFENLKKMAVDYINSKDNYIKLSRLGLKTNAI